MPPPQLKNCLMRMKSQNIIFTQCSSRQGWQSWFLRLHPRRATNADCSLQWLAQTQTKASQQS